MAMKVLLFNHHPDCLFYIWKGLTSLGIDVDVASEKLTYSVGFQFSSTRQGKFDVAHKLYSPTDFHKDFEGVKFSDTFEGYPLYSSIRPEIVRVAGPNAWWDCRMQHELRAHAGLSCLKSCNHPQANSFGFNFCANYVPEQPALIEKKYITQLITQMDVVPETPTLLKMKENGCPVIIAGGDQCSDGFIRDTEILPHTAMLVHNKQVGINCYAVCKAFDTGIPVYMSRETRQMIGFGDLPEDVFLFSDDQPIDEAYRKALDMNNNYIQEAFRSIYTLERTQDCIRNILEVYLHRLQLRCIEKMEVKTKADKSYPERVETGFFKRYMSGQGLDIGFRGHSNASAVVPNAIGVDIGYDGAHLPFDDGSFDFVHSSHCLEDMESSQQAIRDWFRVLKTGGHLICSVPHQYLYERKKKLPSNWNPSHKHFYTPGKLATEFENALEINEYRIRSLRDKDAGYNYDIPPNEHPSGQYEIEIVIQKIEKPGWDLL
jgi:SAM-dependent methyltransferase